LNLILREKKKFYDQVPRLLDHLVLFSSYDILICCELPGGHKILNFHHSSMRNKIYCVLLSYINICFETLRTGNINTIGHMNRCPGTIKFNSSPFFPQVSLVLLSLPSRIWAPRSYRYRNARIRNGSLMYAKLRKVSIAFSAFKIVDPNR
jgi:hypothetical protein